MIDEIIRAAAEAMEKFWSSRGRHFSAEPLIREQIAGELRTYIKMTAARGRPS